MLWRLLQAALFLGFSGWFVLDGAYLYPAKSQAEATNGLTLRPFAGALTYDELPVEPANPEQALKRLREARPDRLSAVAEFFGQPANFSEGEDHYWVSQYGWVKVPAPGGAVNLSQTGARVWYKSLGSIREQFYWALIPLPIGLFFLYKLYRAVTLRVIVDGEGLIYGGRRIPFSAIRDLRDFNKRGWIDLYYDEAGTERRLRLDWEKFAKFDEVVAALCTAKGLPNAVAAWRQQEDADNPTDDDEVTQETGTKGEQ